MKKLAGILFGVLVFMNTPTNSEEEIGIIGRVYEDGLLVIYKFVNEMPSETIRTNLTWLTVISWKYDGKSNNGMPNSEENQNFFPESFPSFSYM